MEDDSRSRNEDDDVTTEEDDPDAMEIERHSNIEYDPDATELQRDSTNDYDPNAVENQRNVASDMSDTPSFEIDFTGRPPEKKFWSVLSNLVTACNRTGNYMDTVATSNMSMAQTISNNRGGQMMLSSSPAVVSKRQQSKLVFLYKLK